jgi:ribosomal protein L29
MQRVKAHELRSKDESALVAELTKQRKDLAALRVSKVSSQPQVKLSKIRVSIKNSLFCFFFNCDTNIEICV